MGESGDWEDLDTDHPPEDTLERRGGDSTLDLHAAPKSKSKSGWTDCDPLLLSSCRSGQACFSHLHRTVQHSTTIVRCVGRLHTNLYIIRDQAALHDMIPSNIVNGLFGIIPFK